MSAPCPTCQGELTITERLDGGGGHSTRCLTCYGTGDPESYGAQVRTKLADMSGDEIEELVLDLIESFFGADGRAADVPLSGADFIERVGEILAPFHPENLRLVSAVLVARLIERLPHTTVREAVIESSAPAHQEEEADGQPGRA